MDIREFVAYSMERARQGTQNMVKELRQPDLAWRPGPQANHVGFLLFHIFRTEDRYFHVFLSTGTQVWEREGWNRRWRLPAPHPNAPDGFHGQTGNSWTPEQVGAWQPPPKEELLDYAQQVRASALEMLKGVDLAMLDVPVRPERPQFTRAWYLHAASHHEAQHQAQIDYVVGMMKESGGRQ